MQTTRTNSIFKSTKVFVESSVGLTVDTVQLVRNELAHTARLNTLENDAEFDETLMSQITDLLTQLDSLPAKDLSATDKIKKQILDKRLAKLQALI